VLIYIIFIFAFITVSYTSTIYHLDTDLQFYSGDFHNTEVVGSSTAAGLTLVNRWKKLTTNEIPLPRRYSSIAYDAEEKKIVLFGGLSKESSSLNDTWIFDVYTKQWKQVYPRYSPEARFGHTMNYIGNNEVLLFGGMNENLEFFNDIWVYNTRSNTWLRIDSPGGPQKRAFHSSAVVGNKIYYFGGLLSYGEVKNDLWQYDTTTSSWTFINLSSPIPGKRYSAGLCYDTVDRKLILFGGYTGTQYLNDTWSYDVENNTFVNCNPSYPPGERAVGQMVYGVLNNMVILFGGRGSREMYNDTWFYNYKSNEWRYISPNNAISPEKRDGYTMVYLQDIQEAVLFGGAGQQYYNDIWGYKFRTYGEYVTPAFDADYNYGTSWETIQVFPLSQPPNTTVKFQIASSTDNVSYSEYVGYDGTTNTYWAPSPSPIDLYNLFDNKRFVKVKFYLSTSYIPNTPFVDKIVLSCNRRPSPTTLLHPKNSSEINLLTPSFMWLEGYDIDGDSLTYTLQISTMAGFDSLYIEISNIEGTSVSIKGLTELFEGKWYWRVRSSDSKLQSLWSEKYNFVVDTTPPAQITNFVAYTSYFRNNTIELTWTAPGNNNLAGNIYGGTYVIKYSSYLIIDSEEKWSIVAEDNMRYVENMITYPGKEETFSVSGLLEGTSYYFSIKTVDAAGNVSKISAVCPVAMTNAKPEIVFKYPSGNEILQSSITLQWSYYDPNPEDFHTFNIYISTDDGQSFNYIIKLNLAGKITYYALDSYYINNSTAVRAKVEIFDRAGSYNVAVSNRFAISNPNLQPSVEIIEPKSNAILSGEEALIKWHVYDGNFTDYHRYIIYISTDGGNTYTKVKEIPYTNTKASSTTINTTILPNTPYALLKIYCEDSGIPSLSTTVVSYPFLISNNNLPPKKFFLKYPVDITINSLRPYFSWEPAVDPNNDSVTYTLKFSTDPTFYHCVEVKNLPNTEYTPMQKLADEATYYWYVEAVDILSSKTSSGIEKFYTSRLRAISRDCKLSVEVLEITRDDIYVSVDKVNEDENYELKVANNYLRADPTLRGLNTRGYYINFRDKNDNLIPDKEVGICKFKIVFYLDNEMLSSASRKNVVIGKLSNMRWENKYNVIDKGKYLETISYEPGIYNIIAYAPQNDVLSEVHNFPNPFTPGRENTMIMYTLASQAEFVEVSIYSLAGNLVWKRRFADGEEGAKYLPSGYTNIIHWDGRNIYNELVASGTYICSVKAKFSSNETKQRILLITAIR
jgi:N-acetylneuraminic acid mutarotase